MASQPLEILWEDTDFLAINKPAGLNSQPVGNLKKENVFDLLRAKQEIYLHHRLDKETSGIMLFGKTPQSNPVLSKMFQNHELIRTYWALAKPLPHNQPWIVENFLRSYKERGRMKQQVRKSSGDFAKTEFRIVQKFQKATLVEARPHTGRMHQIRIHLAGPGYPIWGDSIYGGQCEWAPRLMLHALSLEFEHPFSKEKLVIPCPLAKDFKNVLEKLE